MTTVDEIIRAINEELRSRKHKVEDGSYNWVQFKVFWKNGTVHLTFQCEENCDTEFQNGHTNGVQSFYVNRRT